MQTILYNNIPNVKFSNTSHEEALETHPPKAIGSAQKSEPKSQEAVITPPSLCDRYSFEQIIGRGTQGTVYRAKRLKDGTDVAIKQLNVHSVKNWKEYELFHREASVLESLDIRGIARFYEAIDCLEDEPPCSYIVQEWIKGKSVQQMLNEGHRFTMTEVYDILIQTLEILQKLHRHEPPIIHRDIKPSNLMLTPSETNSSYRVTLIDFGAVANPQVQGGGSTMAGTYGYMPPEQLMGAPTPACDVYALAAVGVQLFTGIAPANLPTKDFTLIFEPEMQSKPHELVSLLRQMLNPKVEDRLTDIQAIISRLEQFKNGNYQIAAKNTHTLGIEYEDKLHELTSVFEPGAIELWKDLPDTSPRFVPFAYQQQLKNVTGSIPAELRLQIFKHTIKQKWSVLFRKYIRPTCIAIIVFILCFLMSRFYGWIKNIDVLIFDIILSVIFTIIILYSLDAANPKDKNVAFSNPKLPLNESDYSIYSSQILKLIEKGRKTIATIIDIQYVPIPDDWVIAHSNPREIPLESLQPHPKFVIRYRFNPPDDLREEDIIHEYTTHELPSEKPGDLLPILYYIKPLKEQDVVYSIPYPIPLHDLTEPSLVVDHSKSEFIHPQINIDESLSKDTQANLAKLNHADSVEQLNQLLKELNFTEYTSPDNAGSYQFNDIQAYIHAFKAYLQIKSPSFISIHYNCIKQFNSLIKLIDNTNKSEELIETIADILVQYIKEMPQNQLNETPQILRQLIRIEYYLHNKYKIRPSNKLRHAFLDIYHSGKINWEIKELLEEYTQDTD